MSLVIADYKVLAHSCIKIIYENGLVVYFDPFHVTENYGDADLVFVTHDHYDHMSPEDISKVCKDTTKIILPKAFVSNACGMGFASDKVIGLLPKEETEVDGLKITAVPSYNVGKDFHPKSDCYLGYNVTLDGVSVFVAGDTDMNEDNKDIKCDYAFIPCGGTYTMNAKEAAEFANVLKPSVAVPTHYGDIVGTLEDGKTFVSLVDPSIKAIEKLV